MKKLLIKTSLFTLPFILLFTGYLLFYSIDKGDLIRLGYLPDNNEYDYKKVFGNEFEKKISNNLTYISNIDLNAQNEFTVLTIGDSFSEGGNIGYQNYAAESSAVKFLIYDGFLPNNPIETVYGFLNGDVLEKLKVKYVLLQSVERSFVERAQNPDSTKKIMRNALIKMISKRKLTPKKKKERSWDQFFSRAMIRFSLYNIYYRFDDNAYYSGTYRVKTTENLFSTNNHQLLFYTDDLKTLKLNNDEAAVLRLNTQLNTLSKRLNEKGIKLIVLPSPDKLDIYYDYISNKSKYPRPVFFDLLDHMQKNYLYINSKQILGNAVKTQKDIYFYDDTHWSPFAAKIIGGELDKVITNTR